MEYIQYIEESKTWVCPKTGKYKVICVGGGGTGVLYTDSTEAASQYIYQNGAPTSFGNYLTVSGSQINNPQTTLFTDNPSPAISQNLTNFTHVGGYGGYDGIRYGGNPESIFVHDSWLSVSNSNSNYTRNMFYCPPDGNGGSISDCSMSGNFGAGGFSKIMVNTARKLSTLKFTYKAYYNGFSYQVPNYVPNPGDPTGGSHIEGYNTISVPGGAYTEYYYGDGRFITKKEISADENPPLPKSFYHSSSGRTIYFTKYVFEENPVASNTSNKVNLYPIKVRNNGCMQVDMIELTEGEEVICTVGQGGKAIDAGLGAVTDKSYLKSGLSSDSNTGDFSNNIGDGTNGVIIIQFLGE